MNKAQELWLKIGEWINTTEIWDETFTRWQKDKINIRINREDHHAYINGFQNFAAYTETLKILNSLRVPKTYVTFGQGHKHKINGKTFDKDCVAVVYGDRDEVFRIFDRNFCFEYSEEYWEERKMEFFPRGYIEV